MMPPTPPAPVLAALKAGQRIEAIKALREASGLGLKEAKDWIEAWERGADPGSLPAGDRPPAIDRNAPYQFPAEAIDALRRGDTMGAIKAVHAATGGGLAEAKAMVEYMQRTGAKEVVPNPVAMAVPPPPRASGLAPGEVPREGAGAGKWIVVLILAAAAIGAVLWLR